MAVTDRLSDPRLKPYAKRIAKLRGRQLSEFKRLIGIHIKWCEIYGIAWDKAFVERTLKDAEKGRL